MRGHVSTLAAELHAYINAGAIRESVPTIAAEIMTQADQCMAHPSSARQWTEYMKYLLEESLLDLDIPGLWSLSWKLGVSAVDPWTTGQVNFQPEEVGRELLDMPKKVIAIVAAVTGASNDWRVRAMADCIINGASEASYYLGIIGYACALVFKCERAFSS